ncbi:Wzz/FepE/Etk N-terminal domain-containing protein [Ruegeria sp. HKCCD8929]|uniref:GumC family protein n=1 Tax=Ruegeria sp. HKCCD8929 TaxID=2683006 RepID=UPI001487B565|nr:Wzz/FepE/Etk N-terminal domain-containing protein [Ruegeria sp. HKCCD8929]
MLDRFTYQTIQTGQPPAAEPVEADLLDLFVTLWRHKWVIAICAAIIGLIGGYYAFAVASPKYVATAALALQARTERVVDLDSVMPGLSTDLPVLNTEIEVIRSRQLLEQLVTELDLLGDPEFNKDLRTEPIIPLQRFGLEADPSPATTIDETVSAVADAIAVSNLPSTYVFHISAKTGDPQKSALIANTLAQLYIEDQIGTRYQATENAIDWLSQRVATLELDIVAKENQVKELRAASQFGSVEALQALNRQSKDMRSRLADIRNRQVSAKARLTRIEALMRGGDLQLAAELADPELDHLANAVTANTTRALNRFNARLQNLHAETTAELSRLTQQATGLEASLVTLQKAFESQSADLVRLRQLERDANATSVLYETFLARLKETAVQRGLQQADSRILSKATPGEYAEPARVRTLAISILLGAVVGAALILFRLRLQTGLFRTAEELEAQSGLPVIGQIPRIQVRDRDQLVPYLRDRPTSVASEAVRNLRTSLLLSDLEAPPQIILISSAVPGEGKTTNAIALTQNLAGLDKRVLLVEGDIRRRTLHQYIPDCPDAGLLEVISGKQPLKQVIRHDAVLGADVLTGETSYVNAADVFSSARFRTFLTELRAHYDHILIDSPPVLAVPDARIIGQSVDAILISVAWNQTTRTQVADALQQFSSVNLSVTGLVLSQIDVARAWKYGGAGGYGTYPQYYDA